MEKNFICDATNYMILCLYLVFPRSEDRFQSLTPTVESDTVNSKRKFIKNRREKPNETSSQWIIFKYNVIPESSPG